MRIWTVDLTVDTVTYVTISCDIKRDGTLDKHVYLYCSDEKTEIHKQY